MKLSGTREDQTIRSGLISTMLLTTLLIMCDFSVTGLNHERAINVAFLPMYSLQDARTSQVDTLLTCMRYSCVYPQASTGSEIIRSSRVLAGETISGSLQSENKINNANQLQERG